MADDGLIDRLAQDLARELTPVRRTSRLQDGLAVVAICVLELVLFLALGMARPDMPRAMDHASWWWKACSLFAIALASGIVAVLSLDPVRSPRRGLRLVLILIACCLAIGVMIDLAEIGLDRILIRLDWQLGWQCLTKMTLLALPVVLGLGVVMRRGAPTDREATSWAAAIASAAWGTFVFVFACPSDDPVYILFWYIAGCALVTLVSRTIFRRLARW